MCDLNDGSTFGTSINAGAKVIPADAAESLPAPWAPKQQGEGREKDHFRDDHRSKDGEFHHRRAVTGIWRRSRQSIKHRLIVPNFERIDCRRGRCLPPELICVAANPECRGADTNQQCETTNHSKRTATHDVHYMRCSLCPRRTLCFSSRLLCKDDGYKSCRGKICDAAAATRGSDPPEFSSLPRRTHAIIQESAPRRGPREDWRAGVVFRPRFGRLCLPPSIIIHSIWRHQRRV